MIRTRRSIFAGLAVAAAMTFGGAGLAGHHAGHGDHPGHPGHARQPLCPGREVGHPHHRPGAEGGHRAAEDGSP
jgi:hypothetical protein